MAGEGAERGRQGEDRWGWREEGSGARPLPVRIGSAVADPRAPIRVRPSRKPTPKHDLHSLNYIHYILHGRSKCLLAFLVWVKNSLALSRACDEAVMVEGAVAVAGAVTVEGAVVVDRTVAVEEVLPVVWRQRHQSAYPA